MTLIPDCISDEKALEDLLSEPSDTLIEMMKRLEGDILILGAAGKMGITLGRMAVRAVKKSGAKRKVIGVARFTDSDSQRRLEQGGVETIRCDLLNRHGVEQLPSVENVVFMAGRKFGSQGNLNLTWAMNVLMPSIVAERFTDSRIAAFSTGCVYPFVTPSTGGCTEETPPAPVGEYAQSCLGRERVFGYYSDVNGVRVCLIRLNYAIDLRYGVLHDIARKVWRGEPVDVSMGWFNAIWQGDANNQALLCLEHCVSPSAILNITGPEIIPVRWVAQELAQALGKQPKITGMESETAWLNNSNKALSLFGSPRVSLSTMIQWTADWIKKGGRSLEKPTHFEVRDGKY